MRIIVSLSVSVSVSLSFSFSFSLSVSLRIRIRIRKLGVTCRSLPVRIRSALLTAGHQSPTLLPTWGLFLGVRVIPQGLVLFLEGFDF